MYYTGNSVGNLLASGRFVPNEARRRRFSGWHDPDSAPNRSGNPIKACNLQADDPMNRTQQVDSCDL